MRKLALALSIAALVLGLTPALAGAAAVTQAEVQPRLAETLRSASPTEEFVVFVHADDIATAEAAVRDSGLAPLTTWDRVAVAVGQGAPDEIQRAIAHDGVTYVEQDQPIEFLTDTSHAATRGAEVLAETPYDGSGISIAINDTGVDGTHPAFQLEDGTSKVARNVKSVCPFLTPTEPDPDNFLNDCLIDVPGNDSDTISMGGHGTHVAGTAAGVRDTTAGGEEVHGAAPGATVIGISVGQTISVYGGNQGLNWVLEHHEDPCATQTLPDMPTECDPIGVVNNSWGPDGGGEFDPDSAVSKIQDALIAEGVVVVWAAGNNGGDGSTNVVNPPAQSPTPGVLGVANYDDQEEGTRDGTLNSTSSRGEDGRPETYPDISAPGTNTLQACRYYLAICRAHGDLRYPDYAEISGTSMAAPHIAGIVAQLYQAGASGPAEIEDVLEDTAYEFTFGADYEDDPRNQDSQTSYDKGHGLVDALAAVEVVTGTDIDGDGTIGSGSDDGSTGGGGGTVACTPETFSDPEGDATAVVVDDVTPTSEPALDVTSAWLTDAPTEDGTGRDVTFHWTVTDLPDQPGGTQGQGEYFDFNFTYAGGGYYITAGRNLTDGEYALLGRFETTRATLQTGLPVTFDPEADTITATLPASAIADNVEGEPVITDGSKLEGFELVSRRDLVFVVPNADTATSACAHTVGVTGDDGGDNTAPTASFTHDPEEPRPTETVTFDASASEDPDGDDLTYRWDLGDGTSETGRVVTHAYEATGEYEVTVTVDDGTDTATSEGSVTVVENLAPTADADTDAERPRRGEEVAFDGTGSSDPEGDELSYSWDLGDGSTAEGELVTHSYDQPGRYTVTLTVDDGFGGTDTDTLEVQVVGGPPEDRGANATSAAATSPAGGGPGLVLLALAGLAYALLRRRVA